MASEKYIKQYFGSILEGRIVSCEKMKAVSKLIIHDIEHQDKWMFDEKLADKHIDFVEKYCRQPTGEIGKPLRLELFQKATRAVVFGFVDERGLRRYWEVMEVEARKNGKTTSLGTIAIHCLCNDNEGAPQIYFTATKKDQADLGFTAAHAMVIQSPALKKRIKKRVSDLYYSANMGFIKSLASNTNTLDGLNPHLGVIDELAAHKNRDVYDLVKQGQASRTQPLLWSISTNGFVRENIFDDQYQYSENWLAGKIDDERYVAFIYELDNREEWQDEDMWIKANPGLGTIKKLDFLRSSVEKAKVDPAYLPTVLTKDFNIKENSSISWLTWEECCNVEPFEMKRGDFVYGIGGIDAADSVDLAAACVLMMRKDDPRIYKMSMYWLPKDVIDEQTTDGNRRERDGVPYTEWVKRGLMRTTPGNKVDKRVFLNWFQELQRDFGIYYHAIGYDDWHMTDDSIRVAFQQFVGADNFVKVIQGPKTFSDPMKEFKADLAAKKIVNNNNPIDNWCRANGAVRYDVNNNIALDKKNNNAHNRIDGLCAELDAYIVMKRKWETYSQII